MLQLTCTNVQVDFLKENQFKPKSHSGMLVVNKELRFIFEEAIVLS